MEPFGWIELTRSTQYANKIRHFVILIDGQDMGNIEDGGTRQIPLSPGDHEIELRIDWCGSGTIPFRLEANECVRFACDCRIQGWRLFNPFLGIYYILFQPSSYLRLSRVD
ncbi:hypothetical protein [Paenibacillus xanthanilyticus]|uniref:Uncharacterized protein n=1 Tax=Paenibacillus xanthanilyticus TaxID=1783531 RepID=A0ABV8JXZ5_9BACL